MRFYLLSLVFYFLSPMNSLTHDNLNTALLCLIAILLSLWPQAVPVTIIFWGLNILISLVRKAHKPPVITTKRKLYLILFSLLYLWHVAGMLWSYNTAFGVFDLEVKLSLVIFPFFFFLSMPIDRHRLELVLTAFLSGLMIICLASLVNAGINYTETTDKWVFFYNKLSLHTHPTIQSIYLLMGIAILFYLMVNETKLRLLRNNGFLANCVIIFILFIVLLSSKTGTIIMLLFIPLLLGYFIIRYRKWKLGLIILFGGVASLFLLFMFTPLKHHRIASLYRQMQLDKEEMYKKNIRFAIWEAAVKVIRDSPMLGVGTGDIKDELIKGYESIGFERGTRTRLNAHNQYLQTFGTLGIVGIALLVLGLLIPFIHSMRGGDELYIAFLILVGLSFLTESFLETQAGVVFYALFNSLFGFKDPTD